VRIILGSGSPRRKSILEEIFGAVEIIRPVIDERIHEGETVTEYTQRITDLKMDNAVAGINSTDNYILITSDTVVCINDMILGKPSLENDSFRMLEILSGKEHSVITGIAVLFNNGNQINRIYDSEKTSVFFKKLDENTIYSYLKLVDCSDKAGSYAVQEHGDLIIQSVNGSLTNVIGFPLRLFFRMMNKLGAMDFF